MINYLSFSAVCLIVVYFVFAYTIFSYFEPAGSPLRSFWYYSWYFLVTVSTVGYGDIVPASVIGKITAGGMIWLCIGAFGVVIGQAAAFFADHFNKKKKGLMHCHKKNHIIIVGYYPERTERIYDQIMADRHFAKRDIVLCFSPLQTQENPLPGKVQAVKGILDSDDVMIRAGVEAADKVLIDVGDDAMTLSVALSVVTYNREAQVVAGLRDMFEGPAKLARISRSIECSLWENIGALVQALQDPGTARLLGVLTFNNEGNEFYRFDIPQGTGCWSFGDLFVYFKQRYNAILIAVAESPSHDAAIIENPDWNYKIEGGAGLFYIADKRLTKIVFP